MHLDAERVAADDRQPARGQQHPAQGDELRPGTRYRFQHVGPGAGQHRQSVAQPCTSSCHPAAAPSGDGIEELRGTGLPVGAVVVNQVRPQDLDHDDRDALLAGSVDRSRLGSVLTGAGVEVTDDLLAGLLEEGVQHAERRDLEDGQRALVRDLGVPVVELTRLASGVGGQDLGGLYELAEQLCTQGLA